ncbi:MAG: ATP-binding cassette domain-containing protein [Eubacteriales bacterium]|nr:ATP-binding cassette domain-containing protein [Eubacteriales bacterium]
MSSSPLLKISALSKSFGSVQALSGVSLEIDKGSITAVVGDNGSGKSTLVKILSGGLQPDAGNIELTGHSYQKLTYRQALDLGIRTVYQDLSLDPCKNSYENIFLGKELKRGPFLAHRAMRQKAADLLEGLNIHIPDLTVPVSKLSGGQRQGLALARALLHPGQLLLLDEPTAAMGVRESEACLSILRQLRQEGLTQVLISHNLHQVMTLADYVYVLRSGQVIGHSQVADLSFADLDQLIKTGEGHMCQDIEGGPHA